MGKKEKDKTKISFRKRLAALDRPQQRTFMLFATALTVSFLAIVALMGILIHRYNLDLSGMTLEQMVAGSKSYAICVSAITVSAMVLVIILCGATFHMLYVNFGKKMNTAVSSREELFTLLASSTDIVFALLDRRKAKPLYISDNTEKIIGNNPFVLDTSSKTIKFLLPEGSDNNVKAMRFLNEQLEKWDEKSEFTGWFTAYSEHEHAHNFMIRLYPVEADPNELVCTIQDYTEVNEREEQIKDALKVAETANVAKTRFLANMSHDIRTPMNAIVNMAHFVMNEVNDPNKVAEYTGTIIQSSEHLLHIINDILDMSRVESGKVVLANEPFNLEATMDNVYSMTSSLVESKGQLLDYKLENVKHNHLVGDKMRLSQVIINIVNNAVKFTPDGGKISFHVRELDSIVDNSATFRFIVKDNGIGIPESSREHLFEPFNRVDTSMVRQIEGSGLGLSITKSFVDIMGGHLSFESKEGKGTTFTIELSFAIDKDDGKKIEKKHAEMNGDKKDRFAGIHSLLAEDNAINRKIATMILQRYGMTVDTANNGIEAVETFNASEDGYYDIIFMDIQMPEMDGYQAAEQIRASGRDDSAKVPIVAMTANVFAEDIEKARFAGMNAHVGKPIEPDVLENTIENVISKNK